MLQRIKQQAAIIGAINEYCSEGHVLAGLSQVAIADWADRNSNLRVEHVRVRLISIAKEIGCLHDRSNPPKGKASLFNLELRINEIHQEMQNCFNATV